MLQMSVLSDSFFSTGPVASGELTELWSRMKSPGELELLKSISVAGEGVFVARGESFMLRNWS